MGSSSTVSVVMVIAASTVHTIRIAGMIAITISAVVLVRAVVAMHGALARLSRVVGVRAAVAWMICRCSRTGLWMRLLRGCHRHTTCAHHGGIGRCIGQHCRY